MQKSTNHVKSAVHEILARENAPVLEERFDKVILYIGSAPEIINKLKSGFKQVNVVPTISEATAFLSNATNPVPSAVFCRLEKAVDQEFKYLSNVMTSLQIPLVGISTQKNKSKLEHFLKNGADDIFGDDFNVESVNYWIDFIQILKSNKDKTVSESSQVRYKSGYKNAVIKRTFDIIVSSVLLILLSPIFLIVALIIKLESKGNVFYTSKRAGSGYRIFDFYKFRSMTQDADTQVGQLMGQNQYAKDDESDGKVASVFFKVKNDPRITRFGNILRKTSIDELPQLFNVLKGDMSLVGNRPLPLYEAEQLTKDQWAMRFLAPAGITGLWQVTKRGQAEMSEKERVSLDVEYAQQNNFLSDMRIMFMTVPALLQKEKV